MTRVKAQVALTVVTIVAAAVYARSIRRIEPAAALDSAPPAAAVRYSRHSRHFDVVGADEALVRRVAGAAEEALRRIAPPILGPAAYPHRVRIILDTDACDREGCFARRVGPDGALERSIRLACGDKEIQLNRILAHELCHVILTEWFGDAPCPLFLQEGLAVEAEADDHDEHVLLAGAAAAMGEAIDLAALTTAERFEPAKETLAYAQSYSLVAHLRRSLGPEGFSRFLQGVKAGDSFVEAVRNAGPDQASATTMQTIENLWRREAIEQATVLTRLQSAANNKDVAER